MWIIPAILTILVIAATDWLLRSNQTVQEDILWIVTLIHYAIAWIVIAIIWGIYFLLR